MLLLLLNLIFGVLSGLGKLSEHVRAVALSVSASFFLVSSGLLRLLAGPLGLHHGLLVPFLDGFGRVRRGLARLRLVAPLLRLLDGSCCVLARKQLRSVHGVSLRGGLPPTPLILSRCRQFVR